MIDLKNQQRFENTKHHNDFQGLNNFICFLFKLKQIKYRKNGLEFNKFKDSNDYHSHVYYLLHKANFFNELTIAVVFIFEYFLKDKHGIFYGNTFFGIISIMLSLFFGLCAFELLLFISCFLMEAKVKADYQYIRRFIYEKPIQTAQFWMKLCLFALAMIVGYDSSYRTINHYYVQGYLPNNGFGSMKYNQLGYVYSPFLAKFSKTTWINTTNNSTNNNQNVKFSKNPRQANFAYDPTNKILANCARLDKSKTNQTQSAKLLHNVLQDTLLKDKRFYIQGSTSISSYAPTHKQIMQHMNLQKIVNPNLGLVYHNNQKTYTGYFNQPSYQIAYREYYPHSNLGVMTGVIYGKAVNSTSFVGEQLNFVPTYSIDDLHWDYSNYDKEDLEKAKRDHKYDSNRSTKKIRKYHVPNDPNTFGQKAYMNSFNLNARTINPQIIIANAKAHNVQNTFVSGNLLKQQTSDQQTQYALFNKQLLNKSVQDSTGLNYNSLIRIYPALATIAQNKYLSQLSYQKQKTKNGYRLIVYGRLHNVSSQALKNKYIATIFPFLPKKYLTYDYDPNTGESADGDQEVDSPLTPIKAISDRIDYRNSDAFVAFVIENGQICKMALKISHDSNSLNRSAFNSQSRRINTQDSYETDVIDYDSKYDNIGLAQYSKQLHQNTLLGLRTARRYLSGHGSYLYQPEINIFAKHLMNQPNFYNRKKILNHDFTNARASEEGIINMYTSDNPKTTIVYY